MMDWSKMVREGLERSERTSPTPHPDPDLLAAFAERTISEPEQRGILAHLAGCATCRAVVYLAQPEQAAVLTMPGAPPEVQPRSNWLVMRWVGVAAAVAVVAGGVLMYRPSISPNTSDSQVARLEAPAQPGNSGSAAKGAETALAPKPATADEKKKDLAVREPTSRSVVPAADEARDHVATAPSALAGSNAAKMVALPAAPPAPVLAANNNQVPDLQQPKEPRRFTAGPADRTIAGNVPTHADAVELEHAPIVQLGGPIVYSASTLQPANSGAGAVPGFAFDDSGRQPAPPSLNKQKGGPFTLTARNKVSPNGLAAWSNSTLNHVRWSTTADGQLQRWGDGRRWQPVMVDRAVMFQAVDQSGDEVWAGGTGGALYRSKDDGASWTKVAVAIDGEKLSEDISSVTFHQPGSVTVRTGSGATWVTADDGLHWTLHR